MTKRRKKPPPLGEQIRTVRLARQVTQVKLGTLLGIPQSRISEYEADKLRPSIVQLMAIADVLRARFSTDGKTTVFEVEP